MDLIQYIRLFRRWLWLIVLAAFIGGSISFIVASRSPDVYRSSTMLTIGGIEDNQNPTVSYISVAIQLVNIYESIVRTQRVLQNTADALDVAISPGTINGSLSTFAFPNAPILRLTITYSDPILAADIANELARQLILASPTNLTPEMEAQVELAKLEITTLNQELTNLRDQLAQIDLQRAGAEANELRTLNEQRSVLITQINDTSRNIATYQNTIQSVQARINTIEVIEEATVPAGPIRTNSVNTTLGGALAGAILAVIVVVGIEYFNDTFRNANELTQVLNVPVLGVIGKFGRPTDTYKSRLITEQPPLSRTPEEYRTLRTNLLFTTDAENRVFVVSSASPQEGKSVTAANLAVSMALAGLRVLLIDADLRRPKVHQSFSVSNELGLTTLLSATPSDDASGTGLKAESVDNWRECVQETNIPGLRVITSGFLPKNPAEILGSALMRRWADAFRNSPNIDVVIFDSPPCLAMSDSTVLAASINANVVLVVQAMKTRRTAAQRAKERFTQIGANVVGVVLNGSNLREEDYYDYAYQYYYRYGYGTEQTTTS